MAGLETKIILGELPPFWEKNVLFFANVKSIFFDNEGGAEQLLKDVKGLNSYGNRLLPILNLLFKLLGLSFFDGFIVRLDHAQGQLHLTPKN